MTQPTDGAILRATDVHCVFGASGLFGRGGGVRAVDGVSLHIGERETLGIVGESGSGKSTIARVMLGLIKPTSGSMTYQGVEYAKLNRTERWNFRKDVQVVFQDPGTSLNPRKSVSRILTEVLLLHRKVSSANAPARVEEVLASVGLGPEIAHRMPHELSGGQKQRVAIGRAVAMEPKVIIADEALSALDVSIQAQVLELMKQLQADLGVSYVFISHDLGVVREIADRVAVMHLGRVVEAGATADVLDNPSADYTKSLLAARFVANPHEARRIRLAQEVAS